MRFAPKSMAIGLITAFALATAALAQTNDAAPAGPSPAEVKQQEFAALNARLAQLQTEQAARRTEIETQLRAENPAISADQLIILADQRLHEELVAAAAQRWQDVTGAESGTNINLPGIFSASVRGCTTDGYIYKMTYNMTVNFEQLAAPPAPGATTAQTSLFYRLVRPDPKSITGVTGTNDFMEALNSMVGSVNSSMQITGGRLIDETPAAMITQPLFGDILDAATLDVTADILARYGVTVTIDANTPREQPGRCQPMAEQERPAVLPPIDAAPAPAP